MPAAAKPAGAPAAPRPRDRSQRGGQRQRPERLARELRRRRDHRRIEGNGDGRGHPRPRAGDERGEAEGGAHRQRADDGLGPARGPGVDPAGARVAAQRVGDGEEGRRSRRPVQRVGHARAAVVAGRPQVAGQPHVGALVGRGVTGPLAGGLHPQGRRSDDHDRQQGRDDDAAPGRREPGERRRAQAGGRHRRSMRRAATVERELPCAGRTTAAGAGGGCAHRAAPSARDVADPQRPRRVGVAEHGLDEEQARAGAQPAQLRPEDRGEAGGVQARQRVAPVHDAGVGHPPQRRRVAQARGQLVRELGHLLGLRGEDERAARQRGRELAGDLRDVALALERRDRRSPVPRQERRRQHRQRPEERRRPSPRATSSASGASTTTR